MSVGPVCRCGPDLSAYRTFAVDFFHIRRLSREKKACHANTKIKTVQPNVVGWKPPQCVLTIAGRLFGVKGSSAADVWWDNLYLRFHKAHGQADKWQYVLWWEPSNKHAQLWMTNVTMGADGSASGLWTNTSTLVQSALRVAMTRNGLCSDTHLLQQ